MSGSADKKTVRGREKFSKFKAVLNVFVKLYSVLPRKIRVSLFEKHRYMRGKLGLGIRYALLKSIARECGDNVAVYPGAYILNPQNLSIGSNVSIQPMCYLECGNSDDIGIVIGNDVSIAHGATVMATSHLYTDKNIPIKDQGVETKTVVISDNVWIGAKATVLCGVKILEGTIIGSNAVVTKDAESESVYAGVPARKIKNR